MYTHTEIYIYIYIYMTLHLFRGNHLSNAACPTQVFFNSGERHSKVW